MRKHFLLALFVGLVLLAAPQHTAAKEKVLTFSVVSVTKADGKDEVLSRFVILTLEGNTGSYFTGQELSVAGENGRMKVDVGRKLQVVGWSRAGGRLWVEVGAEEWTVG